MPGWAELKRNGQKEITIMIKIKKLTENFNYYKNCKWLLYGDEVLQQSKIQRFSEKEWLKIKYQNFPYKS